MPLERFKSQLDASVKNMSKVLSHHEATKAVVSLTFLQL